MSSGESSIEFKNARKRAVQVWFNGLRLVPPIPQAWSKSDASNGGCGEATHISSIVKSPLLAPSLLGMMKKSSDQTPGIIGWCAVSKTLISLFCTFRTSH